MSRTGACLTADAIPVSEVFKRTPDHIPPLDHALYDGEDFELLFTVRPDACGKLLKSWRRKFKLQITAIGITTSNVGIIECEMENGRINNITRRGFQHFEQRNIHIPQP
jgi:thiamine monophosphate kinase